MYFCSSPRALVDELLPLRLWAQRKWQIFLAFFLDSTAPAGFDWEAMDHPATASSSLLPRSFHKVYPSIARAEGVWLWDTAGKRYLDFSGSAAVNLIGHGNKEVISSIAEQGRRVEFVHSSQFTTEAAEAFAAELLEFAGFSGGSVFFTCGGSEAVETALKLARQYQVEIGQAKRSRIISRNQAYHGATLGALAASGNRRRREMYLPMVRDPEAFAHIGLPYCYRCAYKCHECAQKYARELELALTESRGTAAAFIAEPISGATLGAVSPPEGYFEQIAALCRQQDVLLIADEVMTGCGRTGVPLAMEHFRVRADIVVLAKGLGSGYVPLGAVIASARVAGAVRNGSGSLVHGFTYNSHPLAVAGGRAVLGIMRKEQTVTRAASLEIAMREHLQKLRDGCESVGDVRGKGLLWGVEFVADRETKAPYPPESGFSSRVAARCQERGVVVYPMQGSVDGFSGDHLLLAPPAVITEQEIAWATECLREAIQAVQSEVSRSS